MSELTPTEVIQPPTMEEMLACVRREIAMRKVVYPNRVSSGRMKQAAAAEEIRRMEGVLAVLLSVHAAACVALGSAP